MKYVEHLLILTKHFIEGIPTETSVAALSDLLCCSERHVKTIVQYLHNHQVISWETQRGRGKKPKLTLHLNEDEVLLNETKKRIKAEQYQDAFVLMHRMSLPGKEKFRKWFSSSLGLLHKNEDNQSLDILRYPFYETDLTMDPLYITSRHDAHMVQQVFDRLVEYDTKTEQLLPSIAHHWESNDGKHWTFYLNKGILFHHGRELTSRDVQKTFDRLIKKKTFLINIKKITTLNDRVIIFELEEVDYLFPRSLSSMKASIIPFELLLADGEKFSNFPVGSGPYRLTQHNENMVRLEVNRYYFATRPWLDRIDIIKAPEEWEHKTDHPFLLNQPNEKWRQVKVIEEGATYITFNCNKDGPMRNKEFRNKICEMLNPENICNEQSENEFVSISLLSQLSLTTQKKQIGRSKPLQYDGPMLRIAAQQIRTGANHAKAAEDLAEQLKNIGIPSQVSLINSREIMSNSNLSTFDLFVGGIALGSDLLLSAVNALQSPHLTIYPCLDEKMKDFITRKMIEIRRSQEETFRWQTYYEMEEFLKSERAIFFLTHRSHSVYELTDSPYVNIKLNHHGRIDYRKVWKKYTFSN